MMQGTHLASSTSEVAGDALIPAADNLPSSISILESASSTGVVGFLTVTLTPAPPELELSLVPKLPDCQITPEALPYSKMVPRLTTPIIIHSHSSTLSPSILKK